MKRFRLLGGFVAAVLVCALVCVPTASAQIESATQLASDFSTNSTSYVNSAIPVVLTIFGVFLGLGILYRWGKRSAK